MIRSFRDKETEALFEDLRVKRFESVKDSARRKLYMDPIHPGEILLEEFMKPLGLSTSRLGRDLHVPSARIGNMVKGKRAITPDLWLGLQLEYDLRTAKRRGGSAVEREVQPLDREHRAA